MKPQRSHKLDRLAKLYDAEILPLWSERFGRMLLRRLSVPPKAMVLDVGTGTGYPALEVLRRMDDHGRIISIDSSSAMLDVAREKAGALGGKRIFFRSESAEPRLSFTDEVFDLVMCNVALQDLEEPGHTVAEFARVTKPGGRVMVTVPLDGTFGEFYDLFREVLIQGDRTLALERLERHLAAVPTVGRARRWFEQAGLKDVEIEHESYKLLFRSSREFFFAPLIEYGPLLQWRDIAGRGEDMQDIFWRVKASIDAYFGTGPFTITVRAALVLGRRPLEEEKQAYAAEEAAHASRVETGRLDLADMAEIGDRLDTGPALLLTTDQIEVMESTSTRELPDAPWDDDELLAELPSPPVPGASRKPKAG